MKIFKKISKFFELSAWFNRKSQHYILGDWLQYISSWDYENKGWNKSYFNYLYRYPKAWVKFMWLSRLDIWNAE